MRKIKDISVKSSDSILSALKQMDKQHIKLLIVESQQGKFRSLVSIGDIQRAILSNVSMDSPVEYILRPSVSVASVDDSREIVVARMRERRKDFMPLIDAEGNIADVIFWEDISEPDIVIPDHRINLPVVIMAGGLGSRLRPLTNVLPKPLIPIGKQTMLEDIMDRFASYGCDSFFISVNYKADFIRHYFDHLVKNHSYHIEYFQEDRPLGTAGSLSLLKDRIKSTFFVSNCDSIIDDDYAEIIDYHIRSKNEITVVSAIKNVYIPYGTLETGENGLLQSIHEKPELTFKINTGMYILEPHLIEEIPSDKVYHITFLIEKLVKEGRHVGVFPVSEGSWIDIGNWDEYIKYIRQHGLGE